MKPFEWTEAKELAAQLVAQGGRTDAQIGAQTGIPRRTLARYKASADFLARVAQHRTAQTQAAIAAGIARREDRVAALDDRWQRMRRVIEARGADPALQQIPGGPTGLLVRTLKGLGRGEDFQIVEEFAVDTGLLAELRAVEQQAAKELGQWTEKAELSGSDAAPLRFTIEIDRRDGSKDEDPGGA